MDVVVERVEATREAATLDNAGGGFEDVKGVGPLIEDAWGRGLLVGTVGFEFALTEYQLFMTELL